MIVHVAINRSGKKYKFNKVSWTMGYDYTGQHFEKRVAIYRV